MRQGIVSCNTPVTLFFGGGRTLFYPLTTPPSRTNLCRTRAGLAGNGPCLLRRPWCFWGSAGTSPHFRTLFLVSSTKHRRGWVCRTRTRPLILSASCICARVVHLDRQHQVSFGSPHIFGLRNKNQTTTHKCKCVCGGGWGRDSAATTFDYSYT